MKNDIARRSSSVGKGVWPESIFQPKIRQVNLILEEKEGETVAVHYDLFLCALLF